MRTMLFLMVFILAATLVAQTAPKLAPETSLVLKNGDYVRNLSGSDLWNELRDHEAKTKVTSGAYEQSARGKNPSFIIPLETAVQQKLQRQSESFQTAAVEQTASTPTRSGEYNLEAGYNQVWGDKAKFAAYVDALVKIHGSKAERSLDAHLNAGGHVFNYEVKALEFSAAMRTSPTPTAHTVLRIFGKTKFNYSGTTVYNKMFFNDEVGKTVDFFIGPVPVSVRGAIGGSAGFEAKLTVVEAGIQGTATPGITSYGKADANVDLWFVKVGVQGHLDLLIDYLPVSLTAQLVGSNLDLNLKVLNNLKALSGKIDLIAKVLEFWKIWEDESWKTYSTTLFSWQGIQKDWTIFDKSLKVAVN